MTDLERLLREASRSLKDQGLSRRARLRILAELEDHFEDAIAARRDAGSSREDAERAALAAFGPSAAVVDGFVDNRARRGAAIRREVLDKAAIALASAIIGSAVLLALVAISQRNDPTLRHNESNRFGFHARCTLFRFVGREPRRHVLPARSTNGCLLVEIRAAVAPSSDGLRAHRSNEPAAVRDQGSTR